jgi:hypothetical protein
MRKSIIALSVLSTFAISAYAEADGVQLPASASSSVSMLSTTSEGSNPSMPAGQDGVIVISELSASPAEAACGCYSSPPCT